MAETNAFRAALGCIGFNAMMQAAINSNGFNLLQDLLTIHQDDDLDKLPKHLKAWRNLNQNPDDQVRVPFVSLKCLKVMHYWVLTQHWIGNTATAAGFTNVVLNQTLERMQAKKDYKADCNLSKWMKFWELFTTYVGRVKGAASVPLSYLVREHGEVMHEIKDAEYETMEDRLIATTVHTGNHYQLDNYTLYDELKPLVIEGLGWGFVEQFDKTKDGRKAVLALKTQAKGLAVKLTRKMKAYAAIEQSVYQGPHQGFTFDSYVARHQEAHNELLDLDEPVFKSKKVMDLASRILG